ncbi:MAG: hypothetical protein ACT4PT_05720 [Methanobacteriota archaeon]
MRTVPLGILAVFLLVGSAYALDDGSGGSDVPVAWAPGPDAGDRSYVLRFESRDDGSFASEIALVSGARTSFSEYAFLVNRGPTPRVVALDADPLPPGSAVTEARFVVEAASGEAVLDLSAPLPTATVLLSSSERAVARLFVSVADGADKDDLPAFGIRTTTTI